MSYTLGKKSDGFWESILNYLDDYAVFTVNSAGNITSWNTGVQKLLGYEKKEFIGKSFSMIFTNEDELLNASEWELREAKRSGKAANNRWHVRKDGTTFWASGQLVKTHESESYVKIMRDATQRRLAEEKIHNLAFYDQLTGLPNKNSFLDQINLEIELSKQNESNFAVLFIDLDRFKFINDSLGHKIGDRLLQEVAIRLKACLKVSDLISRRGGDEFTVLLKDTKNNQQISEIAQRIIDVLSMPFNIENQEIHITPSIGITIFPIHADNLEDLLIFADIAMYTAKKAGGNAYRFYKESAYINILETSALEKDLRNAIKNEEFVVYYQPKLDLYTGKIKGMEALIRWNHPKLGIIPPGKFIHAAEKVGLIKKIGDWVLHKACAQLKEWENQDGFEDLCVSVNVSIKQLKKSFVTTVKRIIEETGVKPGNIELEITETDIMQNNITIVKVLEKLKSLGVVLSIDDFGTGYSSLSRLGTLPIDALKIDRAFITDLNIGNKNSTIVKSIVAIGQSLELKVIAEGVETEDQIKCLKELHCNHIQGYYVSPPLPIEDFINKVKVTNL